MLRSTWAILLIEPCPCGRDLVLKSLCSGLSQAQKGNTLDQALWPPCYYSQGMLTLPQSLAALTLSHATRTTFPHLFWWEYLHVRGSICKPQPRFCPAPYLWEGWTKLWAQCPFLGHFVHVPGWTPALLPRAPLANHLLTWCGVQLAGNFTIWASRPISRAFCQIIYSACVLFGSPPRWDQR